MRIGYFGGSFDPPHNGHLAVARAAARSYALDRTLFVPTGNQPLKPSGASAPYADRLAMVDLLCSGDPTFFPSDLESPHPDHSPNYTVDTLQQLQSMLLPADEIFVLTGVDAFLDIRRWRSPEVLLDLADWIVISRPGFSLDHVSDQLDVLSLTPAQRARVHLLPGIAEPAGATQIRQQLQAGQDVSELLPRDVLHYIQTHQLYRR